MKVLFEQDSQKMYFPIPVENTASLSAERDKSTQSLTVLKILFKWYALIQTAPFL